METSLEETLERNYSDYLNLQTKDTVVNRDLYILLTRTTMKTRLPRSARVNFGVIFAGKRGHTAGGNPAID